MIDDAGFPDHGWTLTPFPGPWSGSHRRKLRAPVARGGCAGSGKLKDADGSSSLGRAGVLAPSGVMNGTHMRTGGRSAFRGPGRTRNVYLLLVSCLGPCLVD